MKVNTDEIADVVACVDCKHYLRTFGMWMGQTEPRCSRKHTPSVDLVTGKVSKVNYYQLDKCRRERNDDYDDNCGTKGVHWAPRKLTPKTTMLLLKR
jgi:hypothetical protein